MEELVKPVVLVVDDVATNLQILSDLLKDEYRVRVANRGEDALRLAVREPKPDLILLDVMMPEMDGHEVCRRLKSDPETQDIPVIFVTALSNTSDEETGLQLGAVDYIVKPFHIPIVKARVRNHVLLKQKSDMLEKLALIDGLTGIPNRRQFDQSLAQEWRRAAREREPLALIMVDVDLFKLFNDNYGHGAGDNCLRSVARAMHAVISRPGDLLVRYGGEEFALLLPNTDLEGARLMAERVREQVHALQLVHAFSPIGVVTVSLGYAIFLPEEGDQQLPEQLLALADQGLYLAKSRGRNQVATTASL